jgi:lauroyl/myristoyl acyltransferase
MLFQALRGLAYLVGRLPFRWLGGLGAPLAWLAGTVLRIRRAHVECAMARAGLLEPARTARAMYASLGRSVLEVLWLSGRTRRLGRSPLLPQVLKDVVKVDPVLLAALKEARRSRRGLVILASHTGNWELAAAALASSGELLVVAKRQSVRSFDRFARLARARSRVRLAYSHNALATACRVLAHGGAVAMLMDQVPDSTRHGLVLSFLGAPALADRSPAALAACTGCPLVVAASRHDGGELRIEVLALRSPPASERRTWIASTTREASRALERFVLAHPTEWMWLHRRWRAPREQSERPSLAPIARDVSPEQSAT